MLMPSVLVSSYYSEGRGVSSPSRLAQRAHDLGYGSIGLVDHLSLAGAVELHQACKPLGLKPITGATVPVVMDGQTYPVVLIAASRSGYQNLGELITLALERTAQAVTLEELLELSPDLHLLTGGREGFATRMLARGQRDPLRSLLLKLKDVFRSRLGIQVYHEWYPDDDKRVRVLNALADSLGLPAVADPSVRYATQELAPLHEALTAARLGISVLTPHPHAVRNDAEYLPDLAELRDRIPYPDAIKNMARLAELCGFDLLPEHLECARPNLPEGIDSNVYLRQLCMEGLAQRYPAHQQKAAQERLEYELSVVRQLEMGNFFLLEREIIDYCERSGIIAAGRGSAAGSIICFTLGISKVDPIANSLLFERFLHAGRLSTPDVDIDIASHRREELLEWVEQRFGAGRREAMTCNYITYRLPSALQDLGRALDLPAHQRNQLSKLLGRDHRHLRPHRVREAQAIFDEVLGDSRAKEVLLGLLEQIEPGHVRHLAPHSGGVILSERPLTYYSPLQRATGGILHLQLDKEGVEDMGLIKCDLLGLRMLGALERAREEVYALEGIWLDYANLPDDPAVWDEISTGDTLMVFQVESPAQMQTSVRVQAKNLNELANQIALIRPGPIQSGTVNPYKARAEGKEKTKVVHPTLGPILRNTKGVLLFQDQQLRIIHDLAGYDWVEAERLRKAIAKAEDDDDLESHRQRFVEGVQTTVQATSKQAVEVWRMVSDFRGYGFCASHAHAFAQHAYSSAWTRHNYPAEYWAAFMTERPGFWPADTLRQHAYKQGVEVLPLDINHSGVHYHVERTQNGKGVRVSLTQVKGVSEYLASLIALERLHGDYESLRDFHNRVPISGDVLEAIIMAGAFDGLNPSRRELLFEGQALTLSHVAGERTTFSEPLPEIPKLPELGLEERLAWDYQTKSYSELAIHPLDLMRSRLLDLGCKPLAAVKQGRVRTAGLRKYLQKPPDAKGFAFVVIEDGPQLAQLVVSPKLWEVYSRVLQSAQVLVVEGRIDATGSLVTVVVERVWGQELRTTANVIEGTKSNSYLPKGS